MQSLHFGGAHCAFLGNSRCSGRKAKPVLCVSSDASGFPVPAAMPNYPPPPSRPGPPPDRTTKPSSLVKPRVTGAEYKEDVPEPTGLAALGLPELNLPEPPPPDPNAPPPRRYRSPYSRPEPPVRAYAPAVPSNPKVVQWLNPPPAPSELLQRENFKLSETCTMTVYFGDITKWRVDGETDAIVAPANKKINAGAAVDGAIHKAAGPRLLSACQRLPDISPQGYKCEVGNVVSTRAFNLPVSRIIHAVGPVFEEQESDAVLEKTYISALEHAAKERIKHIVFPAISCRIFGYPYADGARVAVKAVKENCEGFSQIDFVLRHSDAYDAFVEEARKALEAQN